MLHAGDFLNMPNNECACTCTAAEFTGKLTVYLSSPQFPINTPGANRCSILHPGMCHFIGSPCAILGQLKLGTFIYNGDISLVANVAIG